MNSRTRKKLVATANRREGVYNRTGKPSVTFCGKATQRNERTGNFSIKSRRKRYEACGDVVGMTGFEPAASCSQSRRATKLRYIPMLLPAVLKAAYLLYKKVEIMSRNADGIFQFISILYLHFLLKYANIL